MKKNGIYLATFLASLVAIFYWLFTFQQPLIDQHEFRQAQTALTALFMQPGLEGFLDYETPVLGHPWSIPFEFPFYQWLVASISRLVPLSLGSVGRLLSVIFGLLCIFPALGLMRLFRINRIGQSTFVLLYFSSSIYLYWNRTFMIETTALFFTLTSLFCYARIRLSLASIHEVKSKSIYAYVLLLLLSLCLGILVKVTTIIPSILLLGCDLLLQLKSLVTVRAKHSSLHARIIVLSGLAIIASILVLKAWLSHADYLKSLNPFGEYLTSDRLRAWNYGRLSQRVSRDLWLNVIVKRMFTPIGLVPALYLIFGALSKLVGTKDQKGRTVNAFIGLSILLALAPLLAFTNLHIVHNYYQSANQIFLLMAISASFSVMASVPASNVVKNLAGFAIVLVILGSVVDFGRSSNYLRSSLQSNSDKLAIGELIQELTHEDSVILVVGDDWSSAFSYHARRRSLTLPSRQKAWQNPQDVIDDSVSWLGGRSLGAVVLKLSSEPAIKPLSFDGKCNPSAEGTLGEWSYRVCTGTY